LGDIAYLLYIVVYVAKKSNKNSGSVSGSLLWRLRLQTT